MGSSYFVGIDNGGSSIKCVIFDQEGTPVSSASASVPLIRLNSGGTERDPDLLWQANCDAIRRALNGSGLRPDQITAVSLCGYGGGLVLLDGSGSCVHPVIVSTDSRAEDLLHVFQKDGTDDRVFSHTCQRLWPGQPGMLLPWFVRNDPDTLRRASHILAPKDYIRFRLTGQIATERTDASNTNLFSLYTDTFDPELFACLGISECLPKMPETFRNPCDIAGTVTAQAAAQTGLPEGTPVAAGLYDVASCTLASGILDESILSIVIGTWNISGHLVRNRAELETRSNGMCAFLPGWYFSEESNARFSRIFHTANETFQSFFVGQFVEAIILGSLCFIGMKILKLPYAAMSGTLVGVTAFIPIVGAFIGAGISAFIILTESPMQALIFLIFLVLLQQFEGNIIYPKVVGSSVGLPSIWTLAAVTIGGGLFGIFGMILGVPLAATLYKLSFNVLEKKEAEQGIAPPEDKKPKKPEKTKKPQKPKKASRK